MLRFISAAAAVTEAELTLGEKMSEGVMTLIIGMGTVFVVLIVLWLMVALMGRVITAMSGKKAAAIPAPKAAIAEPVREERVAVKADDGKADDGVVPPELIAVLSAAVASCEGPDAPRLVIRSVRRTTQWNGGRR